MPDTDLRDRMTTLEVKFDNHAAQMDKIVEKQQAANEKLDNIVVLMAEARGAGKMARAVIGFIGMVGGFFGGAAHSLLFK